MAYEPLVAGLRLGSLVEIRGCPEEAYNGQLGQLSSYTKESSKVEVALLNGAKAEVDAAHIQVPEQVRKPGAGGDPESFDMVIGPKTSGLGLAEELSCCIFEKGFCVLKLLQDGMEVEKTIEALRSLGDEGKLGRLPVEVEEGYLGTGGKGKVMWLGDEYIEEEVLNANDENISYLASLFQPYSTDAVGKALEERTAALLSLSLQDDEEADYPQPLASDKVLGDYLNTWRRGLLRVVHFMGPPTASVTLEPKEGPIYAALPCQQESISLDASPNTILLFRTDCFSFSMTAPEEVATMTASFLEPNPEMDLLGWEGDPRAFNVVGEGPPPPPGHCIDVLEIQSRLASRWDAAGMMNTGLQGGTDTVVEIPFSRFDVNIYFCPDENELLLGPPRTLQRHNSFVDGIELFDNKYFEISNNEAKDMGPLQRQVLEVGGAMLVAQGVDKKLANRKSHHSGCSVGLDKDDFPGLGRDGGSSAGGNALAIIANRFSFVFNMKGPNFVCDTACSASLTATHCGKLMLMQREFDPLEFHVAIGTHLTLSPGPWIGCSMSHMVSPQGRCFTFNSSANGYLRGEGTSGMFLKYDSGEENRLAVYRASQVGQDGRSASLTAPNGPAQEEMIARAVKEARMTPPESTCWECHGTGTSLGDPIEVGAVRKIQIKMQRPEPLMMSTMKSNIGHLEGGAAMAGMVKCVLQVMYSQCLASLHVNQLNAHLEHAAFEAFFETECSKFKYQQGHSQVSSLGFGGSNGHAVFWGKKVAGDMPDTPELIRRRMKQMGPAEVKVIGDNPENWECEVPEQDSRIGDKYSIYLSSDDPVDVPIRWVKEGGNVDEDKEATFSITGNFNSWEEDRLAQGDVVGQYTTNVTVPESGILEFRFLKGGDPDQVICPETPGCSWKSAKILGPARSLTNTWTVAAAPDADMHIELMCVKGKFSVVWFTN